MLEQFDGYKAAAEIIVGPISTGSKKSNGAIEGSKVNSRRPRHESGFLRDTLADINRVARSVKDKIKELFSKPIWRSKFNPDDMISAGKAMFGACAISAAFFTGMKFDNVSQCPRDETTLDIGAIVCNVDSHISDQMPNMIKHESLNRQSSNVPEAKFETLSPARDRGQLLIEGYGRAKKRSDNLMSEAELDAPTQIFAPTSIVLD